MIVIWIICLFWTYDHYMNQTVRWVFTPADLGHSLKQARRRAGLTQTNLSERLGVARMTISRLERGEPVSLETALAALAECGDALVVVPKFARLKMEDSMARPEHA
jgi:HTH-type transcriptional regulator/antitoxin HipB